METDRDTITNLAIAHCEDEGAWLICPSDESKVGDDIE